MPRHHRWTEHALGDPHQLPDGLPYARHSGEGDEVWKVLEGTKKEFGNFEVLMTKMESQVGTVQNTIQKLGVRTRAINRTLREVGETERGLPGAQMIDFDQAAGITTFLAASPDDED